MKSNRKRKKLLPITLMLILCVSIGYAFLSSAINLKGQASIKGNNFDVHFENIQVSADSVEVGAENEAKITEGKPTEVTFKAALNAPGDKYEFTVDVVNSGTVDAMIGDLDDIVLTPKQQEVLDYSITYKDGQPVNPMDGIKASKKLPIKITVNYKTDVTAEQIENVDEAPVAVTQAVNYIQADKRAKFIRMSPNEGPTMLNIGQGQNNSKLSELKSYYPNLSTVTLSDSINVPAGAPNWDISEAGNSSVMAYVVPNTETSTAEKTMYDLHIEGDGGISAPINSNFLFELTNSRNSTSTYTNISGLDVLNTSNTTAMSSMFERCNSLNSLDVSNFDTSNVTDMSSMFSLCSKLEYIDISNFDTSNVTNMEYMFNGCMKLNSLDIIYLDTSNVTTMYRMFHQCVGLTELNLSSLDTSKVWNMSMMFGICSNLVDINLSGINTSNVTNMSYMFDGCRALQDINLNGLDMGNVRSTTNMFKNCSNLVSVVYENGNFTKLTTMECMFKGCKALTTVNFSNTDFSKIQNLSQMYSGCSSITSLSTIKMPNLNYNNSISAIGMFQECSGLKEVTPTDLENLKVNLFSNISSMFNNCIGLENIDMSNMNINTETINQIFYKCNNLKTVNLSGASANNLVNTSSAFSGCSNLNKVNFTDFKMQQSSITDAQEMFYACSSLEELDLSSLKFLLSTADWMFSNCTSLTKLNITSFDFDEMFFIEPGMGMICEWVPQFDPETGEEIGGEEMCYDDPDTEKTPPLFSNVNKQIKIKMTQDIYNRLQNTIYSNGLTDSNCEIV